MFTPTSKIKVSQVFRLDGVNSLNLEKVTEIDGVLQDVEVIQSFNLVEISLEQLDTLRKQKVASFVLKKDGKYYYSAIPDSINLVSSNILGVHLCGNECRRMSAAKDEDGGCKKVRDLSKKHIEMYPWITCGYETFNTKHNCLVVVNCSHYEKCPPREKLSTPDLNSARLSLAQFVFEDVKNLAEVKAKIAENKKRRLQNSL